MNLKRSLLVLASSCALLALPAIAQSGPPDTANKQSPSPVVEGTGTDQNQKIPKGGVVVNQDPSTASADSSSVQSNVQTALQKDDQLAGQNIDVHTHGKEIVLTGTVSSHDQKAHAEQVAATAAGSSYKVKNKIKVSASAAAADNQKQ